MRKKQIAPEIISEGDESILLNSCTSEMDRIGIQECSGATGRMNKLY